jgi:glycosyltransferase involved in cell wall biosynthesis
MPIFCSTIIPTVGRDTLNRAVSSVLGQGFDAEDHEVVVVNDSGQSLAPAPWHSDRRVKILNTQQRERSFARNTGAAVACGRYFHFLDDDDWLAPGALQHFWIRSKATAAAWLYGGSQLITEEGEPLIQLHHRLNGNIFLNVMAGEWIPLQASLIKASAFTAVGGFNPLLAGPEDTDLLRRVCLLEDVGEVDAVVAYIVRGQMDTTTDYQHHPALSRWAREEILDNEGGFARMAETARSAYWRGRLVRIYLTSVLWNLRRGNIFSASQRASQSAHAMLFAGRQLLAPCFWRAVSGPYESDTFRRGFAATVSQP